MRGYTCDLFHGVSMKLVLIASTLAGCLALLGKAGEAGVAYAVQALSGLDETTVLLEKVYCYDHYAHSGAPTAFEFIAKPNIPPSNAPEPVPDMNVISASGLKIKISNSGRASATWHILVDAKAIQIPKRFGIGETELLKVTLEAIRRTGLLIGLKDYDVTIDGHEDGAALTKEFAQHPAEDAFWNPNAH